ncbi:MAG TPA: class I SAM-dependent methyltransferase [Kineobactrum sp.]
MIADLPANIEQIKGFLHEAEALALYRHALATCMRGPALEIGSYCGKSTIYLGLAARRRHSTVFALDHHRGSEEHQPGEMFHDPQLYDGDMAAVDTFREFRRNIAGAGLNEVVVPIVASSSAAARHWQTPLALLFIDGGHSLDAALNDYRCWAGHLQREGILAIHDVYADPARDGQAPRAIYRMALQSGLFERVEQVESLAILKRL